MIDIERIYSDKIYNEILKRNRQIQRIINDAIKDLSKRISVSQFNEVQNMREGLFFTSNKQISHHVDAFIKNTHKDIEKIITADVGYGWNLANKKNDELVNSYIGATSIPATIKKQFMRLNIEALNEFLKRTEQGLNLSKKVWKYSQTAKSQIELYLGSGISTGKSAAGISIDIRNYLQEPKKLFRRVRQDGKLVLSKAAKAYPPGSGVYRSSYKNALRLAANETNLAYRASDFTRRQQLPFVTGINIELSAMHPRSDMCDNLVGRYPKGYQFSGFHPLCMCISTSITLNKKEFIDYINSGKIRPQRYVRTIPKTAETWIEKNKSRIAGYKSMPYFIEDNFTADFKIKKSVMKIVNETNVLK